MSTSDPRSVTSAERSNSRSSRAAASRRRVRSPTRHVDDLATGGYPTHTGSVPAVTLADVCEAHVPDGQDVDFLKVDVEGWEAKVLSGGDWRH